MKMSNDRGGFEKSWKKAFENAEINPPDAVWDNIDKKLNASEEKGKRRFLFIKLTVAASVAFALSLAFYGVFLDGSNPDLAFKTGDSANIPENKKEQYFSGNGKENKTAIDRDQERQPSSLSENNRNYGQIENEEKPPTNSNGIAAMTKPDAAERDAYPANRGFDTREKADLSFGKNRQLAMARMENRAENGLEAGMEGEKTEISQPVLLNNIGLASLDSKPGKLQQIKTYPRGYDLIKPDKNSQENGLFVAGVNFSTGVFNPGVTASANTVSPAGRQNNFSSFRKTSGQYAEYAVGINSLNNSMALSETETYEQSAAYSYGANIGYKISKRIIIYSGINYIQAFSELKSNVSITENGNRITKAIVTNKTGSVAGLGDAGSGEVSVDNAFQFASVPLKAGYLVLDKRLNLTVLTGISTEFLLSSSHSGNEPAAITLASEIENTREEAYNAVYFNGIVGLNMGYTLFENYRLSVEPTLRKSLSSFSDEGDKESRPLYRMISFGLSYQF